MNVVKQIGLGLALTALLGNAYADTFFEAGVGYFVSSTVTDNNSASGDATTDISATELNINYGYLQNDKYEYALFVDTIISGTGENSDATSDYEAKDSTIGLQFAYHMNDKMKAWFGYALQRSLSLSESSETGLTIKGDGYLFGYAYKVGSFNLNVEYRVYSYDSGEYGGTDLDNVDYTEETIAVGVSYPF